MAEQIHPVDLLQYLTDFLEDGQSSVDDLISACLRLLILGGFGRARYYERDEPDPDDGPLCVLTHFTPGGSPRPVGYTIPWRDTALAQQGDGKSVELTPYGYTLPIPKWQYDLDMSGRTSVDIPVIAGGRTLGLLAADCEASQLTVLTNDDKAALVAVGAIAGSAITDELIAGAYTPFVPAQPSVSTKPEQYAREALSTLVTEVGAAVGALFEFDWRTAIVAVAGCRGPGLAAGRPDKANRLLEGRL